MGTISDGFLRKRNPNYAFEVVRAVGAHALVFASHGMIPDDDLWSPIGERIRLSLIQFGAISELLE